LVAAMLSPEDAEQVAVRDHLWIVVDRKGFGVIAEIVVGRFLLFATAVADASAKNTIETPKLGVGAPESAEPEGRGFIVDLRSVAICRKRRGRDDAIFGR